MKISLDWLKDYIKLQQTPEEIEHLLTSSGLEVESLEETDSIKGGLRGLVVGEVLEKEKHPDADRLSVTKVNVGWSSKCCQRTKSISGFKWCTIVSNLW